MEIGAPPGSISWSGGSNSSNGRPAGLVAASPSSQDIYLAPAEAAQIGVLVQLADKELVKTPLSEVVEGGLVLLQAVQHLLVDADVFP